jgi:hypothetical protein
MPTAESISRSSPQDAIVSSKKSDRSDKKARLGYAVFARINPRVGKLWEKYLREARPKPTATSALELAIEEFLAKRGFVLEEE